MEMELERAVVASDKVAMVQTRSVLGLSAFVCLAEQLQDRTKTRCQLEKLHVAALQMRLISCRANKTQRRNYWMYVNLREDEMTCLLCPLSRFRALLLGLQAAHSHGRLPGGPP